ncbi:MAG TPA: hypothetical protein VFC35_00075, partial [Gemmatimonadaceae bacterium]|nr:hypothetical protein [Gemmatimonadaceae bacterium]
MLRLVLTAACSVAGTACGRLPGGEPPPATVWLLPSADQATSNRLPVYADVASFEGALVVIDSSTL